MAAVVPAFHLERARDRAAGTCAAYLLRSLLLKSGKYVPGVQERLFFDLSRRANGASLQTLLRWFRVNDALLSQLGYHIRANLVALSATQLTNWVAGGNGYRAAILRVDRTILHPPSANAKGALEYCVGLVHRRKSGTDTAALADPWPEDTLDSTLPATLEKAHYKRNRQSVVLYLPGYS